jgi:hypothetical protein
MPTLNKESCPTCGQSVNSREIALFSGMVQALWKVLRWCEDNNRTEFERKEIKHLFGGNDNIIARFGDWIWFGNLVYRPHGAKKFYGLNLEACRAFFAGRLAIPVRVLRDPLSDTYTTIESRTIREIPNLNEFLDGQREFISRYCGAGIQPGLF